jgi:hypothetical protein
MKTKSLIFGAVAFATASLSGAGAMAQSASPTISDAIAAGKLILEVRPRYEQVDQANFTNEANALTVRTHLGWETASWEHIKGLIEFEDVRHIGAIRYNTTINGKTTYPTVADPDVTELNRLQLTWTPDPAFAAVVGRQRIAVDDQRFVGNANWRQDEQTFDAAKFDGGLGKLKVTYAYLGKINRTVGQAADWDSKSHLLNVGYTIADALKAQGYVYALDFKQAPASSTLTEGVRLTGQTWVSLFKLNYMAGYAQQRPYGLNTGHFNLPYETAEVAATYDIYTVKANYESLGGNGKVGFSTPLATLHIFQGWADAFLTTPTKGIDDANLSLTANPRFKLDYLFNIQLVARYNQFKTQQGGASLGHEWDASAQAAITAKLTALLKYADYTGVVGTPSRRKLWLQLDYNF